MYFNTSISYGCVAKCFHWVIAGLIIFMLFFGYFLGDFSKELQPVVYNIHKLTGLSILMLMLLRALWALTNQKPVLPVNTPSWQRSLEVIAQILLYLLVILMPLAGWVGSVAANRPPHLGGINFELPISPSKVLANAAFDVHGTVAIMLIVLISLHVLAAFYHHFIKKDNILIRMLPWVRSGRNSSIY
jgi:cytochrome b561